MTMAVSGEGHDTSAFRDQHDHDQGPVARKRKSGMVRRRMALVSFVLTGALMAGFAAMVMLGVDSDTDTSGNSLANYVPAPTPAIDALASAPAIWTNHARPDPIFQLRAPELHGLPTIYTARSHGSGGQEDALVFGNFASEALHMRLAVYRMGNEAAAPSTFFVDLVRRAADAGVSVVRNDLPATQPTKFGPAEVAGAVLSSGGVERECTAFRIREGDNPVEVSGWMCNSTPVARETLGCIIDDLILDTAILETVTTQPEQQKAALVTLFDQSASRLRQECGSVPLPVGPQGE